MALQPIPQQRVIEKLDEHMSRRDYAGAERHLLYWLEEALAVGDQRGELMVRNELVGHFRKSGNKDRAFAHAEAALRLVGELGLDETISAGTTYTNAATAFNAFGENERSLSLFGKAACLYEGSPRTDPRLLGGLYNNMALACVALRRFDDADELYEKALASMAQVEHGELEQAITYLNMADVVTARIEAKTDEGSDVPAASREPVGCGETGGVSDEAYAAYEEEIETLLDKAFELLDTPSVPHDGYYAFVCEKCAPVYAHYGYFLADDELRQRAKAIYERA